MPRYRKKPVEIEASQWFKNGDHPLDYAGDTVGIEHGEPRTITGAERKEKGWEGGIVRYFRRPDVSGQSACKHCGALMHDHGWIDTLEGGHIVCPGDFIITGVRGEMYPCKPEIFAATYQAADAGPRRLWLWKNFVDGRPEFWAFDNAYPCHGSPSGDPITLGSPCGFALVKDSFNGRPDVTDLQVLAEIASVRPA